MGRSVFEISGATLRKNIVIGSIFRPPKDLINNYRNFKEQLLPVFEHLHSINLEAVIAGDMNIYLLKINERNIFSEYFDSMLSHGFSTCITLPTRFFKRSATLIDNFLIKFPEKYNDTSSGILFSAISDHLPYFVCLSIKNSIKQLTRNIEIKPTGESLNNFRHEINNGEMYNLLDPNNNYNIIHNTIQKTRIRHLSTKKVKFNKHKHKKSDWLTSGIIKSIKFREKKKLI